MSTEHNIEVHGTTLHKKKINAGDWVLVDKDGNAHGFIRRFGSKDWRAECFVGDRFANAREERLLPAFYALAYNAARRGALQRDVKAEKHSADWLRDRMKREGLLK